MIEQLQFKLAARIPNAKLTKQSLEQTNDISLWLLNADYPQGELSAAQAESLMDSPPYWAFCWASGWVLAQVLVDHPDWVKGKGVLDFGCGSGVAGIAALKSEAKSVTFCDSDQDAITATKANLTENNLSNANFDFVSDYKHVSLSDTALIADVFYDRDNLPLLDELLSRYNDVIVADSRLNGAELPGMKIIGQYEASTIPDLNEALAFRYVTVYRRLVNCSS